jgi:hypothetical protein
MDMATRWLKWHIKAFQVSDGVLDMKHSEFIMFMSILEDAKRRETTGQKFKRSIKLNGIFYNNSQGDFERQ